MHQKLPFNPGNGQIPIIGGQMPQQMPVLQAGVLITPELKKKLEAWSDKTGIPIGEIGATIFRMGLIGLSMNIDSPMMSSDQAIECIPLTGNEKNATLE